MLNDATPRPDQANVAPFFTLYLPNPKQHWPRAAVSVCDATWHGAVLLVCGGFQFPNLTICLPMVTLDTQ